MAAFPYVMRRVVERFTEEGTEMDRLECGHAVVASSAQTSSGTRYYLAPDKRRCRQCGADRRLAAPGQQKAVR